MSTVSTSTMLFLSFLFFSFIVYNIKVLIVLKFLQLFLVLLHLRFLKELYTVLTYKTRDYLIDNAKKCCTMVITHQSGVHLDKSRTGVIVTIKAAAVSKWRDSDKTVDNKCVNWTLHTFRGKLLPVYPHCPKYPLAGAIVIIKELLRQLAEWS